MANTSFEVPWRRNHELIAVVTWGLAIGIMVVFANRHEMPTTPLWAMTAVSALLMGRRLIGAFQQKKQVDRIKTGSTWFMPWSKFVAKLPDDGSYMGAGFNWNVETLEKSKEILNSNPEKLLGEEAVEAGAYWLHGVGNGEKDMKFPLPMQYGHTLIAGTTGAGKGVCFCLAIAQAILRDECVVVIDPKGDENIQNTIKAACAAKGDPDRFLYFHPAFPDKSVLIDPLRNWNRKTEPASRVTTLIPSESGGSDPFTAFCWKVLNSIAQGLMVAGEQPNLVKLRKYIEGDPSPLLVRALRQHFRKHVPKWEDRLNKYTKGKNVSEVQAYINYYNREVSQIKSSTALEGLISTVLHNKEHMQKMITSLIPMLSMLTDDNLGPLLSPDSSNLEPGDKRPIIDTKRVIEKGQVLYLALDSLSDATVGSAIGSMILADLASVAGDRYSFGVGERIVNVFVDEAAEVINEPTIQLMNKGRGAKFKVWIACQTLADFEARMGSEAQARKVLGNANTKYVLRVHDDVTQKYFSEQMPEVSARSLDYQYRSGATSNDPQDFNGMYAETLSKEASSLVPPSLMGVLPDMHYFVKYADGRVCKGRLPIITLDELENTEELEDAKGKEDGKEQEASKEQEDHKDQDDSKAKETLEEQNDD